MKTFTAEDVTVNISETSYPNRTDYSVVSKLEAHTFVNHADSREEAEKIAESHRQLLVQLYSPAVEKTEESSEETK